MTVLDTLRALLRRWYVVVPGILLAGALAFGAWATVGPGYGRTASLLLLPGEDSVPEGGNPYLYIGGLAQAADVVVRAVGSPNVLAGIAQTNPDATVEVARDMGTSGPVISISVVARSDTDATSILSRLVDETDLALADLQQEQHIEATDRITMVPITIDDRSTVHQKPRLMAAVGVGGATAAITLAGAALLDGVLVTRATSARERRPGGRRATTSSSARSDESASV